MSFVRFLGTGSAAPEKVLANADLEKIVDTSDEWIQTRTGIRERRIADPGVATSDIAYDACVRALESASVEPAELDAIIVGTVTPDYIFPSTACLLQSRLGARHIMAFDLLAGCSGFMYALQAGKGLIGGGDARKVLVVGAETLSTIMDFQDRSTCILFGDGAGAAVLSASDTPGIMSITIGANGSQWQLLHMPGGGSRIPASEESIKSRAHFLKMAGQEVFKEAVKAIESSSMEAIRLADLTPNDIDLFIPHQANYRILEAVRKRMGLPEEKVFSNLDRYGNTSSASVPIALDEAVRSGRVKKDDKILISVFGAGFTWGAAVINW